MTIFVLLFSWKDEISYLVTKKQMKLPLSYNDFLKTIQHHEVSHLSELIAKSGRSLDIYYKYFSYFNSLIPASYVLDYTQKSYLHANDKMSDITGYANSYLLDGGLEFGLKLWHKEDLKIFGEKILIDNLKFLNSIPPEKHTDYIFTCNYRVKTRKGEYKNLLQQSVYLRSSDTGMPLATLGFLTDISAIRNDSKIIHTIEAISDTNGQKKSGGIVLRKQHFSDEKDSVLTKREIEILKWVCEGLNSQLIGDKLNLSVNTVNNHRRNLLAKTNCSNAIELFKYAIERGYF